MKPEDLIGLAVPVAFFLAWGIEALVNARGGGRPFKPVRGWTLMAIGFFLILMVVNVSLPMWLPVEWLERHRLMDLTALGLWGFFPAYLASSLAAYGFHRAEHRFDVMWRGLHQMHHAQERVDMPGWVLGHPLETVVFTALLISVSTFVVGVDPVAAALVGTVGSVVVMVGHMNIDTPYWLGFLILRPEQHCLHHERDVHARNYGDIALWDMLFGSFANVRKFEGEVGFGQPAIRALPAMLVFADVNLSRSPSQ